MTNFPLPSKPPSPPRHRPTDLPALDDGEIDFATKDNVDNKLIVNEHTDLNSIPQAQLYQLNQLLLDESASQNFQRLLVGEVEHIDALRAEYVNGSSNFLKQIDWLKDAGFKSIRRTKGDGDCFYRSTAFAFVEQVLNNEDKDLAVGHALSILESTCSLLKEVKIDRYVYDLFYDALSALITNIIQPDSENGLILNQAILLERFQNAEVSNSVVGYLRMVASAQIRVTPDEFEAFLLDPDTAEILEPKDFCERFVDPFGKEADHVQITALCRALKLDIDVAYLDGRLSTIDFVPIRSGNEPARPLSLLYRPGHYDILLKD